MCNTGRKAVVLQQYWLRICEGQYKFPWMFYLSFFRIVNNFHNISWSVVRHNYGFLHMIYHLYCHTDCYRIHQLSFTSIQVICSCDSIHTLCRKCKEIYCVWPQLNKDRSCLLACAQWGNLVHAWVHGTFLVVHVIVVT